MRFAAVILAGGKSSRMGSDKAELIWNEKPLYLHQKNTALKAGFNPVVISRNKNGFMQDKIMGQGPLSGVLTALDDENIQQQQYLCVIPVDMPYITSEILQSLMVSAHKAPIICFENQIFPLMLAVSLRPQLKTYLKTRQSVKGFISSQKVFYASAKPFADNFININTSEHWKNVSNHRPS